MTDIWESLDNARDSISDQIKVYQNITHPLRRLPREILGEIFLTLVEGQFAAWVARVTEEHLPGHIPRSDTSGIWSHRRPGQGAAWRLSSVCSTWRTLVRSTPKLWSYIVIPVKAPLYPSYGFGRDLEEQEHLTRAKEVKARRQWPQNFACVGSMFQLSGTRNLHIVLDGGIQDISNDLIVLISSASSRWEEIYAPWFPAMPGCTWAPNLLNLFVKFEISVPGIPRSHRLSAQVTPKLRKVLLPQKLLGSAAEASAVLPLSQIVEFRHIDRGTRVVPWDETLILLSELRIVEKCSLSIVSLGDDQLPAPGLSVNMEHLTELSLWLSHDGLSLANQPVSIPTTNLTMPNLTTLNVMGSVRMNDIIDFIRQSGCPLRNLSYETSFPSEAGYAALIKSLPHSVVSMKLVMSAGQDDLATGGLFGNHGFLASLCEIQIPADEQNDNSSSPKPSFVPNLTILTVEFGADSDSGVPEDLRLEIARLRPALKLELRNMWMYI